MKSTYFSKGSQQPAVATSAPYPTLAADRDFTTLDGRLIPRALGEAALRQGTALLIGGMLVGSWSEKD